MGHFFLADGMFMFLTCMLARNLICLKEHCAKDTISRVVLDLTECDGIGSGLFRYRDPIVL